MYRIPGKSNTRENFQIMSRCRIYLYNGPSKKKDDSYVENREGDPELSVLQETDPDDG